MLFYQILRPERGSEGSIPVKQEPRAVLPCLLPEPWFLSLQSLTPVHTSVCERLTKRRGIQSLQHREGVFNNRFIT